jgi:serine O-acetyltransferase
MRINSLDDYKFYLKADLTSSGIGRWGLIQWMRHDVMRFQRRLRKTEYVHNCQNGYWGRMRLVLLRLLLRHLGRYLGLEIALNVFGPGLAIVHPYGIIVSDKASIGKNCRIHAGVNIGAHRGQAPTIGDNVYLGPGAKIVGGVHVGDGAVIGANAVVVKDVPPGVTVGGVPAKIISDNDSTEMIPLRGA